MNTIKRGRLEDIFSNFPVRYTDDEEEKKIYFFLSVCVCVRQSISACHGERKKCSNHLRSRVVKLMSDEKCHPRKQRTRRVFNCLVPLNKRAHNHHSVDDGGSNYLRLKMVSASNRSTQILSFSIPIMSKKEAIKSNFFLNCEPTETSRPLSRAYIHYRSKVWGHPENFVSSIKTHFYLSN